MNDELTKQENLVTSAEDRKQKSINRFFGLFVGLDVILLIFIIIEIITLIVK